MTSLSALFVWFAATFGYGPCDAPIDQPGIDQDCTVMTPPPGEDDDDVDVWGISFFGTLDIDNGL